ncbi:MAG: TetR family transcriptional regulator [SAR324 cluster bacterium]|nr:TetR family transcriptional regulator [SAR324 cluster bacterium]
MASREEIREQTRKTRQQLIEAALYLSATEGVASLTLRSVARKADIAPTSFYRHFRDIDELGIELMDDFGMVLGAYQIAVTQELKSLDDSTSATTPELVSSYTEKCIDLFLKHVSSHLQWFHLFFQVQCGASSKLRKIAGELSRKLAVSMADSLNKPLKALCIPDNCHLLFTEILVELMMRSGVELLDEHNLADIRSELINKVNLLHISRSTPPT